LIKSELELTDNSSILNNSSQVKKTLQTILPEVTIPSVKKLLIFASIELESLLINALVFKAF